MNVTKLPITSFNSESMLKSERKEFWSCFLFLTVLRGHSINLKKFGGAKKFPGFPKVFQSNLIKFNLNFLNYKFKKKTSKLFHKSSQFVVFVIALKIFCESSREN